LGEAGETVDTMIEWRCFDLEAQLYGGALSTEGGRVSVPQSHGIGFALDPGVIRAYLRV
jgi:L-alanine-DL-glutamate epimerase-like enolase superfamily enzyme